MAAKLPCPDCHHSDVCKYLKDVVNTINDIYKRLALRKEGRLPIQIEVHCEFYEGEEIKMTNSAGAIRVWRGSDFKWIPDETIAENMVRAYLHDEEGINVSPHDGVGVYIVWQCYILGNYKYLIATTGNDNMYFEVTYDSTKGVWYLDRYDKKSNFELELDYNDDNVESDIFVKDITNYK